MLIPMSIPPFKRNILTTSRQQQVSPLKGEMKLDSLHLSGGPKFAGYPEMKKYTELLETAVNDAQVIADLKKKHHSKSHHISRVGSYMAALEALVAQQKDGITRLQQMREESNFHPKKSSQGAHRREYTTFKTQPTPRQSIRNDALYCDRLLSDALNAQRITRHQIKPVTIPITRIAQQSNLTPEKVLERLEIMKTAIKSQGKSFPQYKTD